MTALVSLEGVRFHYPGPPGTRFELRIDLLEIARGERVAFIGPSGSGKTTLLNLISGIAVPQAGVVRHAGRAISALSNAQRRTHRIATVGMVFQEFELLEYLPAIENVLLPLRVGSELRVSHATRKRAGELAASLGVTHTLRRRPSRLSQGERQRIAICRALITEPSLLMGDEPTGNLDPTTAATTLDLLFEHAAAREATLLIVTHNHAILDRFDRVIDIRELQGVGDAMTSAADGPAGTAS